MRQTRAIPILACWTIFSLLVGGCIELSTNQGGTGAGGAGSGGAGSGGIGGESAGSGGTGGGNETPSCQDNKKNGTETDIDCGGPECDDCAVGKECLVNNDCASSLCMENNCANSMGIIGATVVPAGVPLFNISAPPKTAIGDLLVLFVVHGGTTDTVEPPPAWTEIQNGSSPNTDPRLDVFYGLDDGSPSYSFVKNASDGSAILVALSGVKYGTKGAAENDTSVDIVTNDVSTFLFVSLTNNSGEVPAMPLEFTEVALGNGNGRSMRISYSEPKPAGMYTLTAVAGPGDNIPEGTFAMSVH